MATKRLLTAVLAGVVTLCPATQAAAQIGEGGPLKRRIQSKIEAEVAHKKAEAEAQIEQRLSAIPSPEQAAQAAKVRQVQTALNFFEFDAGTADGVIGDQTRTAVMAYQGYLDYPVTGQLTEEEGQFLVGAYQKAQEDPATTQKVTAAHTDGVKGLLLIFRDALEKKDGAPGVGVMPSFSVAGAQPSLSDRCAKLAGAGLTAGAAPDPASRENATLMLSMAFCQTREAVIADSTAAAARAQGFTPEQITEQCLGFAPALASLVALLPESQPGDVAAAAAAFVERSGQAREQMTGIASTCLGVAYSAERTDLAIGSAQLLVGLGKAGYGELLGHHLALGFGVDARPDLAMAWYRAALADGAVAIVDAASPDRAARILGAAGVLNAPDASTAAPVPTFSVP